MSAHCLQRSNAAFLPQIRRPPGKPLLVFRPALDGLAPRVLPSVAKKRISY